MSGPTLRAKAIRLAFADPELRPHILGMLRTAGSVHVEVLPEETAEARTQHGSKITVGRFLSDIPLYRVIDGEELRSILRSGKITGGSFSVPGERAYGAQWGADKEDVARWGEHWRVNRLGHELFMIEINGKGRVFGHIDPDFGSEDNTFSVSTDFCNTGLGCSVAASVGDVQAWYRVEGGVALPSSVEELRELSKTVGTKPRKQPLFLGVFLSNPPEKIRRALRYEMVYGSMTGLDWVERSRKERELGVSSSDTLDSKALVKAVLLAACSPGPCSLWWASSAKADSDSLPDRADGENTFAVVLRLKAEVVLSEDHDADLNEQKVVGELDMMEVYNPVRKAWETVHLDSKLKVVFPTWKSFRFR
jgi:hypothetical protein